MGKLSAKTGASATCHAVVRGSRVLRVRGESRIAGRIEGSDRSYGESETLSIGVIAMRDANEVLRGINDLLREKETELARTNREVEALRVVASILASQSQPEPSTRIVDNPAVLDVIDEAIADGWHKLGPKLSGDGLEPARKQPSGDTEATAKIGPKLAESETEPARKSLRWP